MTNSILLIIWPTIWPFTVYLCIIFMFAFCKSFSNIWFNKLLYFYLFKYCTIQCPPQAYNHSTMTLPKYSASQATTIALWPQSPSFCNPPHHVTKPPPIKKPSLSSDCHAPQIAMTLQPSTSWGRARQFRVWAQTEELSSVVLLTTREEEHVLIWW